MIENDDALTEEEIRQLRLETARAVDSHSPEKYRKVLWQLGIDPESKVGKKRMESFYRACNIEKP